MNKKLTALLALVIIVAFMAYIITDAAKNNRETEKNEPVSTSNYTDSWSVSETYTVTDGKLLSVTVSPSGKIYLGGDSFVKCLSQELSTEWTVSTDHRITSISVWGDTVYASTPETIILILTDGRIAGEWGPYETGSIITSISADKRLVAFADAGNKIVYILKKDGELYSMIGHDTPEFIIPSPYFDLALHNNKLFIANTGKRLIETWTVDGKKLSEFGQPGTAPEAFCGCCNPSHFAVVPQGFVTAEKGINRIKILGPEGHFIEFVSSSNNFTPTVPLDVASSDGKIIYAANSVNSTLYLFERN